MAKPPNNQEYPTSPDELAAGGLRGRVSGVTRIGGRAIALAFILVCALLIAILYGVNKNSAKQVAVEAAASPPPAQRTDEPHFGSSEPLIQTPSPATPPPPLVLPPAAVPNLETAATPRSVVTPPVQPVQSAAIEAAQQREAAAETAQREAEQKRDDLITSAQHSSILAGASGGGAAGVGSAVQAAFAGNGDGQSTSAARPGDPARPQPTPTPPAFLDGPTGQYRVGAANVVLPDGGNPKDFLQAQRFAPISPYEITASSVIPAALITGIDSELAGLLTAQVREDVYDTKTGRYLLIPRGSRLVGVYKSDAQFGQSRVLVAWQRLIFPDTTSIDLLNMSGADVQGGAGLGGMVDNHYGKIFGAALLTSILAVGLELSQPQQQGSSILTQQSPGQLAAQGAGQQLSQVGTTIVGKDLSIPPTIHVAKGYPFLVVVDRDIVLPGPYHAQ